MICYFLFTFLFIYSTIQKSGVSKIRKKSLVLTNAAFILCSQNSNIVKKYCNLKELLHIKN